MCIRDRYKILIVGDSKVGKTAMLMKFLFGKFDKEIPSTVGTEFGSKIVTTSDNKRIKLNIWDTAGDKRYRSVVSNYYRGSLGCIVVFDLTSKKSFSHVMSWVKEAKEVTSENISITIVGNKSDELKRRVVEPEDAANFAGERGCLYAETSAATGANIEDIFRKMAYTISYQLENEILTKEDISQAKPKPKDDNTQKKNKTGPCVIF
eukprot:TRINITY_DN12374_c0_g1_i18.p1 TRINITY_DN12374_c0_g1~~TRINITY_DN12374_c0_g1_i18.p1  ORF type:complete len:207 (-),score=68.55 TRINITY_DN12374_c0_g1_i18:299-919(-)